MPAWSRSIPATPYSIGYVGVSFHDEIAKAGLGDGGVEEL